MCYPPALPSALTSRQDSRDRRVKVGQRAFKSTNLAIFHELRLELETVALVMMCLCSRTGGGAGGLGGPKRKWVVRCLCAWHSRTQQATKRRSSQTQLSSGWTARSPKTRNEFSWFLYDTFIFEIVCFLHFPPHPFIDF